MENSERYFLKYRYEEFETYLQEPLTDFSNGKKFKWSKGKVAKSLLSKTDYILQVFAEVNINVMTITSVIEITIPTTVSGFTTQ